MALGAYRKYTCGEDEGTGIFYDPDPTSCTYQLAEKGALMVYLPTFVGTGKPGDKGNAIGVPTAVTQKAFGLLAMDVFKLDQTKYQFVQDQFSLSTTDCKPVKTFRRGIFCVNTVDPAIDITTILPGQSIWYTADGLLSNVDTGSEIIGTFGGVATSDGFVTIKLDIK